jgi:hypothetical protein
MQTPGTVSRILWHFTGGPLWNAEERRQNRAPKPAAQAYQNLRSILKGRELQLGSYREVVRVRTTRRKYDKAKRRFEVERNVQRELVSAPVCCLADVPIIHLSYLAERYGKFVVGFHRDAVVRGGFNPVFYALEDAAAVNATYRGFNHLRNITTEVVRLGGESAKDAIGDYLRENLLDDAPEEDGFEILFSAADDLDHFAEKTRESFEKFLALVKTFAPDEFGTIYCEREWRALTAFRFESKDVAMVVVPRAVGKKPYFGPFTSSLSRSSLLPRSVPVVPWEDLVEH